MSVIGLGVRSFFATIGQTIYSPSFYAAAATQPTGQAIKYFLKLAVLLMVVTLVGAYGLAAGLVNFESHLPKYVTDLENHFPAELAVTIKGGHITSNVTEPYFVPKEDISGGSKIINHYAVIDTKTPFSTEQFKKYASYVWVTSDTIFYYGRYDTETGVSDIRAMPASSISDMVVDRAKVHGWLVMLEPWVRWLTPVFALLVVAMMYLAVLLKLVYVFVLAALVWLLAKMLRRRLGYGASYRVGLYAASTGFILSVAAGAIRHPLPTFTVTVLALLIVAMNLLGQPRRA